MYTTITIDIMTHTKLQELNARLAPLGMRASASSVDDHGNYWRVFITATECTLVGITCAIAETMGQVATTRYYTINQLSTGVQERVCKQAIDDNYYWDMWAEDRNNSFESICNILDLTYSWDNYDNCHVDVASPDYEAAEIQGARRVIAYIVNHWDNFKRPVYVDKDKKPTMYKLVHKDKNALPKSWQEDYLPTGYCADYSFYNAYARFLKEARIAPQEVTLDNFCYYLAKAFEHEYESAYEQTHSIEYAKEYLCEDCYYSWDGEDITAFVHKQRIGK